MKKTRIFVSSTCYDLAPVRESIRALIQELGHVPVLSEYPSFPVNPFESAISNCRKNVRENTDFFVLLIGDHYGTVDSSTGKSITNLEFETAIGEHLPAYIFIKKSVLTMLPLWKKNPLIEFPGIPNNDVFRFIDSIRASNFWTHDFEKIEDIKIVLREQLSIMFRDLLERRFSGKLDPIASFRQESVEAQRLVLDKPKFWEFLLTAELLKNKLASVAHQYERLRQGFVHVPCQSIRGEAFFNWIQDHTTNFMSIIDALKKQLDIALYESWGPPGQPGCPDKILQEVTGVVVLASRLIDSERQLMSHQPPKLFRPLKKAAEGIGDVILNSLKTLPSKLLEPFADGEPPPGTKVTILLEIPSPDLTSLSTEMANVAEQARINPLEFSTSW